MTLYGLLASLVWAAVAVYTVQSVTRVVCQQTTDALSASEVVIVPLDLQAFVSRFTSDWAKADAMKTIRERYEQSHDWNAVRRAVGLGTMDSV